MSAIHRRMDFRYPPLRFEDFLLCHDSYRVFETDLPLGLDGRVVLSPDGEQKTVYLRRQNTRPRLRFTLAHEIIHAEVHFAQKRLPDLSGCRTNEHAGDLRRNLLEREADFGAAALLVPLWMVHRVLPRQIAAPYPDHVVRHLCRTFRVSEPAMRIQLDAYARAQRKFSFDPSRQLDLASNDEWLAAAAAGTGRVRSRSVRSDRLVDRIRSR